MYIVSLVNELASVGLTLCLAGFAWYIILKIKEYTNGK